MNIIGSCVSEMNGYKKGKVRWSPVWVVFFSASIAAWAEPDLEGVWMIDSTFAHGGYSQVAYTEEGEARVRVYDFLNDDPSLQCIPSGLGRIWGSPGSPLVIQQFEDRVVILYEMFDLRRTIELNQHGHPTEPVPSVINLNGQEMPTMGHSIGWNEDDVLVVETLTYARGYVTTLGQAIPQSAAMRSIERLYRDGDWLAVEVTYIDPILFREPLTRAYRFKKSAFDLALYNCEF